MIQHIESEQPLAIAFNKVISKITTLWIMTRPRIFDDTKGEEAAFKMITYYQILDMVVRCPHYYNQFLVFL